MSDTNRTIQISVSKETYQQAKVVLDALGLTTLEAINVFLKRVAAQGCIPFALKLTEEETVDIRLVHAIEEADVPVISGKKSVRRYLLADNAG
ncbi:type II toxin-antitoxin system RelB/DinJ family antitoxin [Lacticaseibacillus zhaodongensis]|uniref:type II toxin-antitoxin system RelB/DinJ family antitoxin n=1 Tax=Lacticaseibacillus zhaodongensis TaxID=2668065 RepID=UPI0012D2B48F|nr:type II toxin-antitoxin system RelB/DinJ family antitoxin [Lacticaseibacillus zhaodongensis]